MRAPLPLSTYGKRRRSRVVHATPGTAHQAKTSAADGAPGAPDHPPDAGAHVDPRFTFANERTYLAWNRTALALVAGGLAVAQFLKGGFAGAGLVVALPLIALGACLSHRSYRHWQRSQRALRLVEPVPASALPRVLTFGVTVFAAAAIALAVIHFVS